MYWMALTIKTYAVRLLCFLACGTNYSQCKKILILVDLKVFSGFKTVTIPRSKGQRRRKLFN